MSRVFRGKRMRMTALLLSAAMFMGSLDISMLQVQAAQENPYMEENPSAAADPAQADSVEAEKTKQADRAESEGMQPTDSVESEGAQPTDSGAGDSSAAEAAADAQAAVASAAADAPVTEETPSAEPSVPDASDESNGPAAQADVGAEGDEEPTGPFTVKISGLSVLATTTYNGSAVSATGTLKATLSKGVSGASSDEDVTDQVEFRYSISGVKADNSEFPTYNSTGPVSGNIVLGMPKDAGTYTLTVTASSQNGKYTGSEGYQFVIRPKIITIRPNDIKRKIGDDKPEWLDADYEIKPDATEKPYTVTGLVGNEKIQKEPTLTCDVENMKKTGTYTIYASGADAGANYTINYQEGILTISEKGDATITGVSISDKVFDGEPVAYDISGVKVQDQTNKDDITDITSEVTLKYSITGGKKDGTLHSYNDISVSGNQLAEEAVPTDAGTYTLKVTVTSDKYKGEYRKEFTIGQKPVTLKADDLEIKQGAKLPTQEDFTYTITGLVGDDEVTKAPTYVCDIISTEKTDTYDIIPRNASAGTNYIISYEAGKLKVLEKDRIAISGVTIPAKVYDGNPAVCNRDDLKVVLNQSGSLSTDITDKVTFSYSISGTMANGRGYASADVVNGMPNAAGEYTLTVTAEMTDESGHRYQGAQEYDFNITQRPVIIRADDMELTTGDPLPVMSDFTYKIIDKMDKSEITEEGFLLREPTFSCEIENTYKAGTYKINIADAEVGYNYAIDGWEGYQAGTLTVVEREVVKNRRLLRIIAPASVPNVVNGTELKNMELPAAVDIVTRNFGAEETVLTEKNETAGVTWERSPIDGTSYNPRNEDEQTFVLRGTADLPAEVDGEDVSLEVKVRVTVREKWTIRDTVAAPTASIEGGSGVRRGTTVTLSCETEGAEIYYTLDSARPDRKESCRYTSPIEINGFTVIWAYAYKKGQPDSATVKYFYYINESVGGGDEEEPDVPKEDIPANGIIPEGLWMTEVKEFTYTGQAIKPEVRVYDHKKRLEEKQDYTISYSNNVKAADMNASKAPSIIITGKGNYEGKITRRFTILPRDIGEKDFGVDDITVLYNKKAQKPSPVVLWNSKKLSAKTDYAVQPKQQDGSPAPTDVGAYYFVVKGIGNYKGTREFKFTITDGVPVSKLTVAKIANQTYTGKEIKPQLTVKYKGAALEETVNYTVSYENNTEVGTATAVIRGKGDYVGTRKVTFKIVEVASLSKAKAELTFVNTPTYTGKTITAYRETVIISVKNAGQTEERTLTKGTDYVVEYVNNIKAGTATAVFTGIGGYRGTTKKTFKIVARDVTAAGIRLDKSYSYEKGGCKPEPTVTYGGSKLKAGTDYTLSYKKNTAAGSIAELTVKGKGNFTGSVTREFAITPQDISKMTVEAADKVYQNKKNIYKTTVYVTDVNGKRLAAGKDYDKNMEYTYAADCKSINKKKGDPVEKDDIIPAGTLINVAITAKGSDYINVDGSDGKPKLLVGSYRIVGASIAKAKVTIPEQTYTGKEITPDASQIRVELNGTLLKPETGDGKGEYEILGYSNNIRKGTAKVTLHGLGGYGGTKTVSFKIKGKGLSSLIW